MRHRLALVEVNRKRGQHAPKRRIVDLVLRRATGHTSLRQLSVFSNIGYTNPDNAVLHRETLRDHEIVVASAFISESVMFFQENEERILECSDDMWCFSFFCSRFDGVNNDHGKQGKYQTLELDARYVFGEDGNDVEDIVVWAEPVQFSYGKHDECFRVTMHQLN